MYVKKNLYVDEEVWREFIAYVSRKHGKLKGKLCEELSKALKEYLEHAHTDSGKPEEPESAESRRLPSLQTD
jgi:hypothetical protein